jgi:hypothetical protein
MEQRRAARAQDLKTILALRPDQDAAFAAYQASMTRSLKRDHRDREAWKTMTTPQRLDAALTRLSEREARMRAHAEATKAFYAALSPKQQEVFDALGRLHHGGMGRGGWHGRGGERRWSKDVAPGQTAGA